MKLLTQKNHLKIYLKNSFFDTENLINLLLEIINKAFITVDKKPHYNGYGSLNAWAFDFRIPLLNSNISRNLLPCISEYLSDLNYESIALKGVGALPFISLSQYHNIKYVYIAREQKKENGFRQELEGINEYIDKKPICLVDDIINSGRSIQKTLDIFSTANTNINKYFCLANFAWGEKTINLNLIDSILEIHK